MFGFLNCNKPSGFTSRDLVNIVQGRLRRRKVKVGHCGTLDPLADGVLVVGVGPAAKLVPYVHETTKAYRATFRLAAESPTGDLEQEPEIYYDHPVPTDEQITLACAKMTGMITQIPPAYSAIKIDGKRAYDLVRKGRSVEIPEREVYIESVQPLNYEYPYLKLDIVCGTGTYIRSLGLDLAKSLGTVAVMTSLTRTSVGEFEIENSISVDELRGSEIESLLLPASQGVSHLRHLTVNSEECERLKNGLCLEGRDPVSSSITAAAASDHVAALTEAGGLKAIMIRKSDRWCPKKVFPD